MSAVHTTVITLSEAQYSNQKGTVENAQVLMECYIGCFGVLGGV